jgi:hypothetical protein
MVPQRFDRLVGSLAAAGTRRRLLSLVAALPLAGTLTTLLVDESAGKGKGKGKAKGKAKSKHAGKLSGGTSAQTEKKGVSHCISPVGLDLNTFYGVSEQIIAPFCLHLNAGQQWRVSTRWFVNDKFAETPGPEVFVPTGHTPLEDLVAKLLEVRYVIDPGTNQEKTVVFPNNGTLFTGEQELNGPGDFFPIANTITLGALKPLSVGLHEVAVYWRLSAMHCDGFSANVEENCLPAGESSFTPVPFAVEVIPGHQ